MRCSVFSRPEVIFYDLGRNLWSSSVSRGALGIDGQVLTFIFPVVRLTICLAAQELVGVPSFAKGCETAQAEATAETEHAPR